MKNKLDVVSVRLVKDAPIISDKPICSPVDAIELIWKHLCDMDREVFCVVNLKTNGVPINCNFISIGTLNASLAHPREMLKSAILSNAAKMLLLHNHPSGSLLPSKDDCIITDQMIKLCDLIQIPLLDHIIIGDRNEYFSFDEKGMLSFKRNTYETNYENIKFKNVVVAEGGEEVMELVRCISERNSNKGQVTIGKKYWMDVSTKYKDADGDEYAHIYLDEDKAKYVGNMLTSHFELVYRYLCYGASLSYYVNSKTGFLLKDIIGWCFKNPNHNLAENLIVYIDENKLYVPENLEKEFIIKHTSYKEFVERGIGEEYLKYMGYSMYCID